MTRDLTVGVVVCRFGPHHFVVSPRNPSTSQINFFNTILYPATPRLDCRVLLISAVSKDPDTGSAALICHWSPVDQSSTIKRVRLIDQLSTRPRYELRRFRTKILHSIAMTRTFECFHSFSSALSSNNKQNTKRQTKKTHSPVGARRSNTITETATALAWSAITRPSRQRRVDEVTTMCCLILIHSKQMWFAFSSKRYVVYVYSVPFSTAPLGLEQRAPPKPKEVETRTKKKKKLSLRLPAETKQSKEIRSNSLNGRKNRELRKENHVLAMGRRLNAKRRIEFPRYSPAVNKQKKTKWKDQKKRWRKRRRYRAGVVVVGVVGLNIMLLGCWFALFFFCSCDNVL